MNIPRVFDRDLLKVKQARRMAGDFGFLHERVRADLDDRLTLINRNFIERLDIDAAYFNAEEVLNAAPQTLDLMTSNLALHMINDLPGVLAQIRRALKPDGLFIGALFGGETLFELRDVLSRTELMIRGGASPRVFPFADKQQMGALMQRTGFALPVIDSEIITVTYNTLFDLIRDLRGMAQGNIIYARDKRYVGRDFFKTAAHFYADTYTEPEGRIRATFEVIYLCGWSPHASQQKPMTRGSGQINLGDVL